MLSTIEKIVMLNWKKLESCRLVLKVNYTYREGVSCRVNTNLKNEVVLSIMYSQIIRNLIFLLNFQNGYEYDEEDDYGGDGDGDDDEWYYPLN